MSKENVVLVDLSSLYYGAWHASANEDISSARLATIDAVNRCMSGNYGQLLAVCCDLGRSFRKDIAPEYKATREEKPASLLEELRKTKQALRDAGYLLWEADGFEADDVIATACEAATAEGHTITIASADKDLLQMVCPTVNALRTHMQPWKVVGVPEVVEKFSVQPFQLGDFLALVGDKSDNIKGADGIGPKTAAELLNKYYSIKSIYEALDKDPWAVLPNKNQKPGTMSKAAESLLKCRDDVYLARTLVQLRYDAPIDFKQIYEPRKAVEVNEDGDSDFEDEAPISVPGPSTGRNANETLVGAASANVVTANQVATNGQAMAAGMALAGIQSTKAVEGLGSFQRNGSFEHGLEPQSLRDAFALAERLFKSRMYPRFGSAEAILASMIRGREVGLPSLIALDTYAPVDGKLSPAALFLISRVEADPNCEYFRCSETTPTSATYVTKHRKAPAEQSLTYTLKEAELAGLVKPKGAWEKYPASMCRKMAGVFLGRMVYPGTALLGGYSNEELGAE
jgi:5'-3' exonuclease